MGQFLPDRPVILKEKPVEQPATQPAPSAEAPTTDNAVELAYWDGVKDSDDPSLLQTYLDQYPQGLFAKLAAAKIASMQRKAGEQKPVAPTQPDNAAELGGTAYLDAYLAKYPQGQFADLARIRIAELTASAKAEAEAAKKTGAESSKALEVARLEQPSDTQIQPETRSIDPGELAFATQKELARIGCLSGKVDGKWGAGSERALSDYAGRQGIRLASLQPAPEVLDRLKATTVRVCPLVCGSGMEERNGRCEKVKREANIEPKKQQRAVDQKAPTPSPAKQKVVSQTTEKCMRCSGL